MLQKKRFVLFIILLVLIFILNYVKIPLLILENPPTSKIVFIERITPNDEFTMRWIHSVELAPWEEIFRIGKQYEIILDRTRFKAFGAGVPEAAGTKTEIKDGYIIFSGINRKIPQISYGISNFAKHTFYFKEKELKLYEMVENDSEIKIYTASLSLLQYLLKKMAT